MKSGYGNIDLKKTVMVLITVMVLTALSLGGAAAVYADGDEPATSGKCGEHLNWSYADGTLTFTGYGAMDGIYDDVPWADFRDEITQIIIPNAVTTIDSGAFSGCRKVTSVNLPSQLEEIGTGAFAETGLTSIFIPQTVTYIGTNPFRDCPDLASITVDTDNYEYSDHWHADGECNAILKIDRNWDDSINDKAVDVVAGCKNTIMPRDVNQIMPYAFSGCTGLKSVTFRSITPDDTERPGLTSIGSHAFDGCVSLEGLFIPYTVTYIGEAAFSGCGGLKKIEVAPSNEQFYCSNNALIEKNGSYYDYDDDEVEQKYGPVLILGCSDTVIPTGVKAIGEGAFSKCQELTSITIPENVAVIENDAFRGCPKLTEVNFPEKGLSRIFHYAFRDCTALTEVNIPDCVKQILSAAFMGCTSLKEATVPGTDLYFADSLFRDCTALESITFKSGVTDLGDRTFWGCTGLKYVVVPVSLTEELGWSMFTECVSMTDMYYEGTRDQFEECDYISLDKDDTFTTIYSNPPHKVKVHFNSTGPEDVPHEHSYGTTWVSDESNHWHECSCGDKADTAAHTFAWVTDKAATVTETGLKHEECTVCGYKRNENTVIDKLPDTHTHSYSKDWKTSATSHWHECSCGDKADTAAHTFTWITDKAATATLPGVKHEECTVCGYKRNENTRIDPTGSDPVPVTERYASGYTDKDNVTYTGKVMSGNIIVYDRETLEEIPAKGNYDIKWSVDGKSIGKQKFTVTFKGDYVKSDPYTDTFTILPGKGKITSVKPGKKQAVVKYKALKGGVKYQVAYRISGAWKTKTASGTSLTIKKLKSKKTYQFRVRAFKTVKGKTYYGSWSATKKAKIK